MTDWSDWIGRSETRSDVPTAGLVDRFAATLDSAAERTSPDAPVPQGLHWCLCLPDAPTAALGQDGHPRRDDASDALIPPLPLPRRMWAASDVAFLAPVRLGLPYRRVSRLASLTDKQGASGPLTFVTLAHEGWSGDTLAIRETQTIVYRAASTAPSPRPAPGDARVDPVAWDWHRCVTPNEAMLLRYSALTFNAHRIHYDLPYAREVEYYAGLVVHGPLIATLLIDLVARHYGPDALARFAMRAEAPAFAREPLHLVGRAEGEALTLRALSDDGRVLMRAEAQRSR